MTGEVHLKLLFWEKFIGFFNSSYVPAIDEQYEGVLCYESEIWVLDLAICVCVCVLSTGGETHLTAPL